MGSAPEMLWPRTSFRLQCDVVEWICKHIPRWNPISFNGYNLREAGTDAVGEVAIAIANGADIVRVHDVQAMVRVARMTDAIVRA